MANGHDKKPWKACGRPRAAAAGEWAVGGGSGGSDRIGADLAKIYFLLKKAILGQMLINFNNFRTSGPQKWIRLEISVLKIVE